MSILRLLAIDPGDRWCGYAMLTRKRNTFTARCGVLDRSQRNTIVDITDDLIKDDELDVVVCESYQVRLQGFNLYGATETAHLIGALQYRTITRGMFWETIQPGNPADLQRLVLGEYINRWRELWRSPRAHTWNHALSAWAIMARYLIREHQLMLSDLIVKPAPSLQCLPESARTSSGDFVAPSITWEIL